MRAVVAAAIVLGLAACAARPALGVHDSDCAEGEGRCLDTSSGMAASGDSVLQTSAIRARSGMREQECKKLCYKAKFKKWGTTWEEKCTVKQCKGCSECSGSPSAAAPTPSGTPAPAPAGECKNACHSTAFMKWGDTWPQKCQVRQCSGCPECAGGPKSPSEPANHTGQTSLGEIRSGEVLEVGAPGFHNWSSARYSLFMPPAGLSVNHRTGKLTWQPDVSQAGDHSVELDAVGSETGERRRHTINVTVTASESIPHGIYVWPSGGSDTIGDGSVTKPFRTLEKAVTSAAAGDTIYFRGGTYRLPKTHLDNVKASSDTPIVITRLPGERVYLLPSAYGERATFGIFVGKDSVGITFRGLELDGEADQNDVWDVVKKNWWRVDGGTFDVLGGPNGFVIDGQHITVEDCVIHDCWSKAVDIPMGRYTTVRRNVVYNIGHYTVVGGAGIHRKWEWNYRDPDDPRYYRFDISENLVFNVEQRIPSFLPSKGFSDLVFDEGNSIGLWYTKDKEAKIRIANNLVLFGGKTGIHSMDNPYTEVLNNAVVTEQGRVDPVPKGIEVPDRYGIDKTLTVKRNLVHSYAGRGGNAFDVSAHFEEQDSPSRIDENYYSGGGALRDVPKAFKGTGEAPGIHNFSGCVFRDPANLDFRPHPDLPQDVGVAPAVLSSLLGTVADYGVKVAPTGWRHDHVRMVQAILDAAPDGHVSKPTLGPSKKAAAHEGMAYWYDVKSRLFKKMCKCNKLELIPSREYWEQLGQSGSSH